MRGWHYVKSANSDQARLKILGVKSLTAWGRKEKDMHKMPTPTEIAVKEAKEKERYKLLLMAKESNDLESFIATLENLINQG